MHHHLLPSQLFRQSPSSPARCRLHPGQKQKGETQWGKPPRAHRPPSSGLRTSVRCPPWPIGVGATWFATATSDASNISSKRSSSLIFGEDGRGGS
eukprot:scaffold927_cov230-Pinguiococcus_pyrenoidosus.AAC.6